jgi:circadian clock protein KaiB
MKKDGEHLKLRLFVSGSTPASARAIERVRAFLHEHFRDRFTLEVIDIYQLPARAKSEQIIATPTLVRVAPLPALRFVGDLSDASALRAGLRLEGART